MKIVWPCLVALGCSSSAGRSTSHGSGTGAASGDACGPVALGLGDARLLDAWKVPPGCSPTATTATLAVDEASVRAAAGCPADATLGLAPGEGALVHATTLSPAGAGTRVYDDGARVTLVHLMRSPCPNDPRPMPMPWTITARLPAPAAGRTLVEQACTLPPACE